MAGETLRAVVLTMLPSPTVEGSLIIRVGPTSEIMNHGTHTSKRTDNPSQQTYFIVSNIVALATPWQNPIELSIVPFPGYTYDHVVIFLKELYPGRIKITRYDYLKIQDKVSLINYGLI